MWGSLGKGVQGFVGAALENVSKISKELEAEMNAAVLNESDNIIINNKEKQEEKQEKEEEKEKDKNNLKENKNKNEQNEQNENNKKEQKENKDIKIIEPEINNNNNNNNNNIVEEKQHNEIIIEKKVKKTPRKIKSDITTIPSSPKIISKSPSPPVDSSIHSNSSSIPIDNNITTTTTTSITPTSSSVENQSPKSENINLITSEILSTDPNLQEKQEKQQQKDDDELIKLIPSKSLNLDNEYQNDNLISTEINQKVKVVPKKTRKTKTTTETKSISKNENEEIEPMIISSEPQIIQQQQQQQQQENQEQIEQKPLSSIILQQVEDIHNTPQILGSVKEKIQVFEKMKHEEKIIINHIDHHSHNHFHQHKPDNSNDHTSEHQSEHQSEHPRLNIMNDNINNHNHNKSNNDNNEILTLQSQIQNLITDKEKIMNMYDQKLADIETIRQQDNVNYMKQIDNLNEKIQELQIKNKNIENEKSKLEAEITQKNDTFNTANIKLSSQMKSEMDSLGEVIAERERALQTVNVKLAEIHHQYEESLIKISSLTSELSETKQLYKQIQSSEIEYKRENIKLQEILKEKEESLVAFTNEGQALSKKQGEMEKNIRKSRAEIREKEVEIGKLKEKCDQHLKTIEELREVIRQHESNSNSLQKQNTVIQSVSQASQDKITKLENDLTMKIDELNGQRKALELSWSENSDLKRTIAELKAECENLRSQIGFGENKVVETESTRRDLEQREAILRATNRQLQESLQRYMTESASREERMREELKEARNKWQEAIANRESLAAELGNASTPLLRQITSLQESLRVKTDVWQKLESTLSERAIRAENLAENSERKRLLLEEELSELRQKLKSIEHEFEETQEKNKTNLNLIDRLKRSEQDSIERINKLQNLLKEESTQRISFENSMKDLEYHHKRNIDQIKDEYQKRIDGYEFRINSLQSDIANLNNQVEGKKIEQQQIPLKSEQTLLTKDSDIDKNKRNKPGYKPVENESFAITERSHQTILQQDEKIEHLQKQIQQIQISRDALLEEVSFLSSKLSLYEDNMKSFDSISNERKKLKEQNETLLILLGEKEEELENIFNDMKEIKNLYREEINRLIEKSIN